MKKLAIPTILAATIMVAGMFAFMPVEQASTVHTSGTTIIAGLEANAIGVGDMDAGAIDADAIAADAIGALEIATAAITAETLNDEIAPQVVPLAGCTTLFDTDIQDNPTLTMDQDFTVYLLATGGNAQTLTVTGITGGTYVHTFTTTQPTATFVWHAIANEVISIDGSAATVDVLITMFSQSGAGGDCVL